MGSNLILRIVPSGFKSEGFDGEFDPDQPSDLVALLDDENGERELSRKKFDTGNSASAFLLSMIHEGE